MIHNQQAFKKEFIFVHIIIKLKAKKYLHIAYDASIIFWIFFQVSLMCKFIPIFWIQVLSNPYLCSQDYEVFTLLSSTYKINKHVTSCYLSQQT